MESAHYDRTAVGRGWGRVESEPSRRIGGELQSGEHTGFLVRVVSVLRPNFVEHPCVL